MTKGHDNKQNINICIRNLDTNRDTKQLNIFERKMYRRILGPVYDNEKEDWRVLTNKEIYASVIKPTTGAAFNVTHFESRMALFHFVLTP